MKQSKKNAFTLIELVAVLVIMAIIALIVTPLVMSIIRKARISADKRSVDAYGRSIELAIAGYLLDTGKFPTEVSQLTIEYSGSQVVCETTQINPDSSVYLAGCTVAGRNVENYTYGKYVAPTYTAYTIGNQVTYNNINYYVIKDSDSTEESVTLLKAEPLSASDITTYSAGTGAQINGNGGMQYHSNSNVYSTSYVKATVDAWASAQAPAASDARLITLEDFKSLGYSDSCIQSGYCSKSAEAPSWLHIDYWYWTSNPYMSSSSSVWNVNGGGLGSSVHDNSGRVRPVITISKSLISSTGN